MGFDVARFAQELMALRRPQDLLQCARAAAAQVAGEVSFASHLQPGRAWEHATVSAPTAMTGCALPAVRSAMHALYRRLSLAPRTSTVERTAESETIFRALWPEGRSLLLVPMRNRSGRLTGLLAAGHGPGSAPALQQESLQTIATLTGCALETAWQQAVALRDQERMQLFSETAEESFWDWDVATDSLWWGGNVDRLFGGAARGAMRSDWRHRSVHPDDAVRVMQSFDAALNGTVSSWNAEYRLRDRSDAPVHVREHVYFLREADSCVHRAVGTVRDITALTVLLARETAARNVAERASGVKDEFLAMLGHELRNPLAPIVAALTLLERRASGPDRQLEILRRQTQHLVRLVDDLLDVSRISSGKVELSLQRVFVAPLVHRALEMVQPLLEQRRHRVELDLDESLAVQADAARLTQVLTNLLANAAKYTEPGGRIAVSARGDGVELELAIRDNGIGIAPDMLPTIFELFTQARQSIDRAQGGLGLGLSIVRNIVHLHGGSVRAHSAGLGQGTTVVLHMPLSTVVEAAPVAAVAKDDRSLKSHNLLVIDDNEDAANLLAELLAETGHAVRVAHHPTAALRLFDEKVPDLALVDIGLPDMDGYALARRMRLHPQGGRARLVALTGYGSASDRVQALASGFDEHLAKPVDPALLEQVIARLMSSIDAAT
ncbi:hybrid sensor histidine kinase/response regulator [Pseudorhodoferax sp.]|uniref:hybrid sensor histidine kinase/response regulator n=1 Tax=Pseudorhodoferax sp. TaxID=1993553 RepID=UPI002DD66FEB|nr:ATP-binding protein [Pseudorhodoferax sp.]